MISDAALDRGFDLCVSGARAQVSLGELKDEERKESWFPLVSKRHVEGGEPDEVVVGNIQLVVTVRRNYGFNLVRPLFTSPHWISRP